MLEDTETIMYGMLLPKVVINIYIRCLIPQSQIPLSVLNRILFVFLLVNLDIGCAGDIYCVKTT